MRSAVLSPEGWNARYPPGTRIRVTRANGTVFEAVTAGWAQRVGHHPMIELDGYRGLWLLAWCEGAPPAVMPQNS